MLLFCSLFFDKASFYMKCEKLMFYLFSMYKTVGVAVLIIFLSNTTTTQAWPETSQNLKLQKFRDGFINPLHNSRKLTSKVTNLSKLEEISTTDWPYKALQKLVKRYDCISGYPDKIFAGKYNLSRNEFSAGLNQCLNTIEELLKENIAISKEDIEISKHLMQAFDKEVIISGSKVSNLEKRVAYIENHQFSTTTTLSGQFVIGLTGITNGEKKRGIEDIHNTNNLGYRGRIELNTSFDGNDSLYTRVATGTIPSYATITDTFEGDLGFQQPDSSDLSVQLIIYQFNLAENVRMFIEPVGGAFDDFVPTVNFLDGDRAFGAITSFGSRNPLYFMAGGPGIGFRGTIFEVFEWSGGYLANNGNDPDLDSGMFNGPYGVIGQVGWYPYGTDGNFTVDFTYVHGYNNLDSGTGSRLSNFQSFIQEEFSSNVDTVNNAYGIEFMWSVSPNFIFGGWGGFTTTKTGPVILQEDFINRGNLDIWNWAVTLAFPDALIEGGIGAIVIGMEPWVAKSNINLPGKLINSNQNASFHLEAFYEYTINNNVKITPGIVIITSPNYDNANDDLVIGTIRTTFTF